MSFSKKNFVPAWNEKDKWGTQGGATVKSTQIHVPVNGVVECVLDSNRAKNMSDLIRIKMTYTLSHTYSNRIFDSKLIVKFKIVYDDNTCQSIMQTLDGVLDSQNNNYVFWSDIDVYDVNIREFWMFITNTTSDIVLNIQNIQLFKSQTTSEQEIADEVEQIVCMSGIATYPNGIVVNYNNQEHTKIKFNFNFSGKATSIEVNDSYIIKITNIDSPLS